MNRTYHDNARTCKSSEVRWWDDTPFTPSQTLSALPHSPCNPVDRPVPATHSPTPATCPHSPVQAQPSRNGCPSQSQTRPPLTFARLSADRLPIPPTTRKKQTPPAAKKKKTPDQNRAPLAGVIALAQRGEAITKYDPKNGKRGKSGSIVTDHPD